MWTHTSQIIDYVADEFEAPLAGVGDITNNCSNFPRVSSRAHDSDSCRCH